MRRLKPIWVELFILKKSFELRASSSCNPYWTFCSISRLIIHLAGERKFSGLFPHYAGLFRSEHAYFSTDMVVPGSYMIRPEWNMFMPAADMITPDWKLDKYIFIYTLLRVSWLIGLCCYNFTFSDFVRNEFIQIYLLEPTIFNWRKLCRLYIPKKRTSG